MDLDFDSIVEDSPFRLRLDRAYEVAVALEICSSACDEGARLDVEWRERLGERKASTTRYGID